MKYNIIILFFLTISANLPAQLYDAEWVTGYEGGTTVLDFRIDTVGLSTIPTLMGTLGTNANICDEYGNLLYYTNGCYINDSNGNLLMNGDTLSPCAYTSAQYLEGLDVAQAAIFLPAPGDSTHYYIIHFSLDTFDGTRPATMYYSLIDKDSNGGLGAVVKKNVPILQNTPLRGGGMTACKHANGRDYWIVMGASEINIFYKFLLTPDTILGPYTQSIGPAYNNPYDLAYSKFSQDGSKFSTVCAEGYVLVMDFDRCTGDFSNPITIANNAPPPFQPISGGVSVEFSPSGRFLYVCNVVNLNQYDLSMDTIQDSIQIYLADSNDQYQMDQWQLAPNGKLYGSTYSGGLWALHVVNYPDSFGTSCNFVYGGQPALSLDVINVPNLINYNLGPLAGPCDTIPVDTAMNGIKEMTLSNLLRIMPNPADKYLYVEAGTPGNYEFDLLNALGQMVAVRDTRQVDDFNTEGLASGVYFLKVKDRNNSNEIATKKVVVQH